MNLGILASRPARRLLPLLAALALGGGAVSAVAAVPATEPGAAVTNVEDTQSPNVAAESVPQAAAAEPSTTNAVVGEQAATGGYTPLGPEWIKGQPSDGAMTFQNQYTPDGHYALWMHDAILLPLIVAISLVVLGLLLWVVARYNRRANATPSRTSHNTLIEVIWTAVPVLILVAIAVPSITLLSRQYRSPPEDALTVKVTGYQWYWGYTYPDNGGFEVISNMKDEGEALAGGEPPQLAVDNRMVVPVGEPIRIQTTGADVIHSFAVPSLWFKIDAVPGRLNERVLFIEEPGIYYGQCSELCGARHAYMPIAVEAVPRAQFDAWLLSKGGTLGGPESEGAQAPTLAPPQEPESGVEGAPGAGAPPTAETAPGTPVPEAT
ncbi:cytochrome c oxidase subunit II [Croceibacterium mercuriale]|uniref:cytochrome c oxidase subunit II n=1 Tax=Croceibacterium mercuriale TaxID=1572751 RepID=UPI0009DDB19D|nr:cytochrome c oxidase subunit II [Croceibacterium mercuriale]